MGPTTDQLLHWGADNAGAVLTYGEWWRIVTAMFVHVGILHLATNMWCLWNLGLLAEPLMGSFGVLAVYLLTGASGNLLSTFYNWYDWAKYHGAEGALAGFFPRGRGSIGSRLWDCRGANRVAEIAAAAGAAAGSEKTAQIRDLLCGH